MKTERISTMNDWYSSTNMYFLPLFSASPYYKTGRNTKFDWKLQANHVSSRSAGLPLRRRPRWITPEYLQTFTARSFPDLSVAMHAQVKISSVVNFRSLLAYFGWTGYWPFLQAAITQRYPLSTIFVKGRSLVKSVSTNSSCISNIPLSDKQQERSRSRYPNPCRDPSAKSTRTSGTAW